MREKLLFLLNENKGGELSLYYRAATLSHIGRFISRYQLFGGDVGDHDEIKWHSSGDLRSVHPVPQGDRQKDP